MLWAHLVGQHGFRVQERRHGAGTHARAVLWTEEGTPAFGQHIVRELGGQHAVLSAAVRATRPRGVEMLTKWPLLTRLETRTKESNIYASIRVANPGCAMKVKGGNRLWRGTTDRPRSSGERFELEHRCWDPKDGELCVNRSKSGETLMEDRSDSDVQIDRQICV